MFSMIMLYLRQGVGEAIKQPASLYAVLLLQPLTDCFQILAIWNQAIALEDLLQEGIPSCCLGLQQGPYLNEGQAQAA